MLKNSRWLINSRADFCKLISNFSFFPKYQSYSWSLKNVIGITHHPYSISILGDILLYPIRKIFTDTNIRVLEILEWRVTHQFFVNNWHFLGIFFYAAPYNEI